MNHWIILIISLVIPLLVGALGGFFTAREIKTWYAGLNKPSWNPPNWIFGPVWTILYILMGISLYLVWTAAIESSVRRPALILFLMQLLLNFLWSLIFFKRHEIAIALADIITLWVLIMLTIFSFAIISPLAAWLLVPYIVWVSFASLLNYSIWKLNRQKSSAA